MSKKTDEQQLQSVIFESPKGIAELLRSAAHPARIKILALLLRGEKNFSKIMQHTELSKTALANQMNHLVKKGLVKKVARGQYNLTVDGKELLNAAAAIYIDSTRREEEQRDQLRKLYTEGLSVARKLSRKVISKKVEYLPCWLSYTGAMGGALRALGVKCDIVDVGGRSGYAFLINVSKGKTCPSGPTAIATETWEQVCKGTETLGYKLEVFSSASSDTIAQGNPTPQEIEKLKKLFERIKSEIDEKDRPVVLWGLVTPEYGIVKGYEGNSYIVSTFRSITNQPEEPILFYDLKAPGCIDAFFFRDSVKIDSTTADKEALERAINFASAQVPILDNYMGGPKALDEWANVLENIPEEKQDYFGNSYVGACVAEGREISAAFVARLAKKHSGKLLQHLQEATACYEKGTNIMEQFTKIFPFRGPVYQGKMQLEHRRKAAELLRKVKPLEEEAIRHMKIALKELKKS